MGQKAVVIAKDKSNENLEKLNKALKEIGFTRTSFTTEADILKWYKNVLTDGDSDYSWIREQYVDENGQFTLESYKELLKIHDEKVGYVAFDYAFGRTSTRQLNKIARFIYKNQEQLKPIKGMDDILERGEAPNYIKKVLKDFKHKNLPAIKLPEDEQYHPDCQSGIMLCKSFSPNPFWVIFGKVDEPKFMKEKIYANDIMNRIYRDEKNLGYMLIPLVSLGVPTMFGKLTQNEFFTRAWDMGLREHPNFFFPFIYKNSFVKETKKFYKEVAKEFSAHYTPEELQERYNTVRKHYNKIQNKYHTKCYEQLDAILSLISSVTIED